MKAIELEIGMCIWVKEYKEWLSIEDVNITLGRTAVTFENGDTLFFNERRRFVEL